MGLATIIAALRDSRTTTKFRRDAANELERMDRQLVRHKASLQRVRDLATEARSAPVGKVDAALYNIIHETYK